MSDRLVAGQSYVRGTDEATITIWLVNISTYVLQHLWQITVPFSSYWSHSHSPLVPVCPPSPPQSAAGQWPRGGWGTWYWAFPRRRMPPQVGPWPSWLRLDSTPNEERREWVEERARGICNELLQARCPRGSCFGIHRTRVMVSLHVATISVRVRHFDREGLRQLQNWRTEAKITYMQQHITHDLSLEFPASDVTCCCI